MSRSTATLRLDNGLRVRLIGDPQSGRAAALMRIEVGSLDEPPTWPGLAHLLEHLLFRGSEGFAAEEGLMRWAPAHGGRLNATTQATQTAFFFEVDAEWLEAGVARLIDMLGAPLLAAEAADREAEVIDAEYRLLRADAETRCEAAQRQAFSGIDGLHRFHIGSRAAFGADAAALRRALRQFHRQGYRAAGMTLWLQGPQPLPQLAAIARRFAGGILGGPVTPRAPQPPLTARGDYRLGLAGAPQLRLTLALNRAPCRGALRLLESLLLDEAPGGLLAWLRAQELCDAVRLTHERCGDERWLLSWIFTVNRGTADEAATLERALFGWLHQLAGLGDAPLAHYRQLANRAFDRLAPLEHLRERAFGLPPVEHTAGWAQQLSALLTAPLSRLTVRPEPGAASREVQGLPLSLTALETAPQPPNDVPRFHFFSPSATPPQAPQLPQERAPLRHRLAGAPRPVLLLRPVPQAPFSDEQGYRLQAALRTTAATLAHRHGQLSIERFQGVWQLQLAGDDALMCHGMSAINRALSALSPAVLRDAARTLRRERLREQGDIAIRRLLAQLPAALSATPAALSWRATLIGGHAPLQSSLSRLLSDFPYPITAAPQAMRGHAPVRLSESGDESALLLFFPLPEITASGRLALRLLAQLYAPHYFQRLRVERNIGYVVQCAFHRCADIEGIFFGLQSPRFTLEQLHRFTLEFLQDMTATLASLNTTQWDRARQTLMQSLRQRSDDPMRRARETVLENSELEAELAQFSREALQFWQRRIFTSR
ncbi:Protease 3 precursor [Serratia ficaria]|uniref:pyrroloquinoline quinone biosynthesis protein PqqF n=1 Tax=Serratia ficaria TaxID=61651 RepID=UPI002183559E|nr:pyrroloquinoline quinone biosynthesis protein PqqF [Serratia ficaria]CAI2500770.1 Protease 3 precursor [Serratia ficaria]